jgi:hypothetical protein
VPKPSGICVLSTTANTDSGTTALTLTKPTGTVDGDVMIICLAHKGAGYATMPAGWTLVAQDVSSGMRGEGANYSITGLADCAAGSIRTVRGALLAGSPVHASGSITFAAGVSGDGRYSVGPIVSALPNVYVLSMIAAANDDVITNSQTVSAGREIQTGVATLATVNTTNGTDCGLGVKESFMVVPGTLDASAGGRTAAAGVSITCILAPETGGATAGSRYYPTFKHTRSRFEELAAGAWDLVRESSSWPTVRTPRTFLASQNKSGGGTAISWAFSTNQTGVDILFGRCFTPPLEAVSLAGGTFTVSFIVNSRREDDSLGNTPGGSVRYKAHVYVTNGQTGTVRTVLVDNEVDGSDWTTAATATRKSATFTYGPGEVLAGDSIGFEIGARVVTPTPTPDYPPDEYAVCAFRGFGSCGGGRVPWKDQDGSTGTDTATASWVEFTETLTEQAPPASPANLTSATAIEITAWPYVSPWTDVSAANSQARQVWFKFTAPQTGRCFIYSHGSNYNASIRAFVAPDFVNQTSDIVDLAGGINRQNCDVLMTLDAVIGTEYFLQVYHILGVDGSTAQSSGGLQRLSMSWYSAPQEDDLYIPASAIYALRDGVIVNINTAVRSFATTGVALDYSRTAVPDFNSAGYPTPDHVGERLLVGLHDFDLVEVFDLLTLNMGEAEVGFLSHTISGNGQGGADGGSEANGTIHLSPDGTLYAGWFGDGYQLVLGGAASAQAAFYNNVSEDAYTSAIRTVDFIAALIDEAGPNVLYGTPHLAAGAPLSPWHVELAPDGLLYYVAGGMYYDESQIAGVTTDHRAAVIKRYDTALGAQAADFATVPLATGPREGLYGLAIHPSGEVLVCNGPRVDRLSAAGAVIQSYTFPEAKSRALVDVVYTANAEAFWVFDQGSATLFKVDVDTGDLLQTVDTYFWPAVTTQMAIYQPDGITPVPPDDEETLCLTAPPKAACWGEPGPVQAACLSATPTPAQANGWLSSYDIDAIKVGLNESDVQP